MAGGKNLVVFKIDWESIEQWTEELYAEGFFPEVHQGEPADILKFFECELPDYMAVKFGIKGFQTGVRDLDSFLNRTGLEGYTSAPGNYSYIHQALYDDQSIYAQRRLRSTVGHETFHSIGHVPHVKDFISANGMPSAEYYREAKELPAYMNPDVQSDVFSGCVLMPRKELQRLNREGKLENVSYLAERFNVNPAFVRSRLRRKTIFKG